MMNNIINREDYIKNRLKEHYDRATSLGYEVFCIVVQGSQNYNMDVYTDDYQSDIDTRCIVLPKFDDFVKREENISFTYEFPENKEHIDIKDLENYVQLWKKGNIQFLEILFSDFYYVPDKYKDAWELIRSRAEEIVANHKSSFYNAIAGMAMEKYKALDHPYPTIKHKIDKFGYDPKQAHHILRLYNFIDRYSSGESFKDCLVPQDCIIDYLIELKKHGHHIPVEKMKFMCRQWCDRINEIKKKLISELDKSVNNSEEIDTWLDNIRLNIIKNRFKEELLYHNDNK